MKDHFNENSKDKENNCRKQRSSKKERSSMFLCSSTIESVLWKFVCTSPRVMYRFIVIPSKYQRERGLGGVPAASREFDF